MKKIVLLHPTMLKASILDFVDHKIDYKDTEPNFAVFQKKKFKNRGK